MVWQNQNHMEFVHIAVCNLMRQMPTLGNNQEQYSLPRKLSLVVTCYKSTDHVTGTAFEVQSNLPVGRFSYTIQHKTSRFHCFKEHNTWDEIVQKAAEICNHNCSKYMYIPNFNTNKGNWYWKVASFVWKYHTMSLYIPPN